LQNALTTIGEIIDFQSFPYGNAAEKQNADGTWAYTCQHGVNECIGNMYEACAMGQCNGTGNCTPVLSPWWVWWPFFYCMENSQSAGVEATASTCAKNNGLDWNTISACAGSNPAVGTPTNGNPLMHWFAVQTNNLQPPHQWTPWVVVNGAPLSSAQIDLPLIPIVCKAYVAKAGCVAPAGCNSVSSMLDKK